MKAITEQGEYEEKGKGRCLQNACIRALKKSLACICSFSEKLFKSQAHTHYRRKILTDSKLYKDGRKAYEGLIINGYDHYRVFHTHNEFLRGKCHVNGIKSFWSFAKRRLAKFNVIHSHKFVLKFKESEFRFNERKNIYSKMISILKLILARPNVIIKSRPKLKRRDT